MNLNLSQGGFVYQQGYLAYFIIQAPGCPGHNNCLNVGLLPSMAELIVTSSLLVPLNLKTALAITVSDMVSMAGF